MANEKGKYTGNKPNIEVSAQGLKLDFNDQDVEKAKKCLKQSGRISFTFKEITVTDLDGRGGLTSVNVIVD
jgi:hypothetical protein